MKWVAVRIPNIQAIRYEWQYVSDKEKKPLTQEAKRRIISSRNKENRRINMRQFISKLKEFLCIHKWEYVLGSEFFYDNSFKCSKCGKVHE